MENYNDFIHLVQRLLELLCILLKVMCRLKKFIHKKVDR